MEKIYINNNKELLNIGKSYIIQLNAPICDKYYICNSNNNSESVFLLKEKDKNNTHIYKNGIYCVTNNYCNIAYNPIELLEYFSKEGFKITELYNINFSDVKKLPTKDKTLNFIALDPIHLPIYEEKNNSINKNELYNIIVDTLANTSFPFESERFEFDGSIPNINAISNKKVFEIRDKLVLIYYLHTFYKDLSICYNYYEYYEDKYSETNYTYKKSINNINKIGNILFKDNFCELPKDFYKSDKNQYLSKIIYQITNLLNYYSNNFFNPTKIICSCSSNEIITNKISSDLFDMCWEYILVEYTSFSQKYKYCKCGKIIEHNKKRCEQCAKKAKKGSSEKTQKSKRSLILEIKEKYENNKNKINPKLKPQVLELINCLDPGNSRKLHNLKKKDIKNIINQLNNTL